MSGKKISKSSSFLMLKNLVFLFTFFVLASCNSDSIYEENVDFDDKVWVANDTLNFTFRVENSNENYNVYYNVRNTITYPFQNLYINYTLENQTGDTLAQDLVNMTLFDPKTGKPFGKGLGDIFSHQFEIMSQYQFPDTGVYQIKLNQFMRRDSLPEILSIGISVKDAIETE